MNAFVNKYGNILAVLGLFVVCVFVYFLNIGNYPLMDVDETRYVSMARDMFNSKDFMTLYLNGEYFFEKPPLYFWLECLSFGLFGKINEFTARFPVALLGMFSTFAVYFTGKKIVNPKFGFISALVLTTTVEFAMLARYAILDIVLTSLIVFSVLSGFLTQFVQDRNKKYFWWLFYLFSALAVIAKGIPGFVIPFGVMFFVTLFNKTFKQNFKPQYILPGVILFLLIVLPWHIAMFNMHDPLFFNEYIMKHHINRFFSSSEIARKQPFYFYFLTLLWGAMPYMLSLIAVGIAKLKNWVKPDFLNMTDERKFLWFNIIAFCFTFLFFSSSSTKLVTYILPVYFFLSFIIGQIWCEYINEGRYKKAVNISVYILGGIFVLASFTACFSKYFLPAQLYSDILSAKWFCIILLGIFGVSSIIFAFKHKFKCVFASYVVFIMFLTAFGTPIFYNIDYKFGQNDLMNFAKQEVEEGHKLYVINGGRKYSVLYYYGKGVNYISFDDDTKLNGEIFDENSRAIIKNKDIEKISKNHDFEEISKGRKWTLVKFINKI
ncbi:glycosyltransferase family 39 protein [bacterium]|nr:glycosyltransferase family 39 protein [bacterium]